MNARFQARMDWREEGSFRPQQYAPGSNEQIDYLAEMATIYNEEAQASEHPRIDIRQSRHRENDIAAQHECSRNAIDSNGEKAIAVSR